MGDDNPYGVFIRSSEKTEFMYSEGRDRADGYDTSSLLIHFLFCP